MVQLRIKKENNRVLPKARVVSAPTAKTMRALAKMNGWTGAMVNRKGDVELV